MKKKTKQNKMGDNICLNMPKSEIMIKNDK